MEKGAGACRLGGGGGGGELGVGWGGWCLCWCCCGLGGKWGGVGGALADATLSVLRPPAQALLPLPLGMLERWGEAEASAKPAPSAPSLALA